MAGADENIIQDHVNFLQKKELYIPNYIQNYETLLTYFLANFLKLIENIRKNSIFEGLFKTVLEGERGNTGLYRAISTIGNTQNRETLYKDLSISK